MKDYFTGTAADGSTWSIPVKTVIDDMIATEDDDKWPRPITREMALDFVNDNAGWIDGWILESAAPPSMTGLGEIS